LKKKDRYPYHYWILWFLRDKGPTLKASLKRMVETKFNEKGLWIPELEEPTAGKHQQRKFDSDFENRVYRDLKLDGRLTSNKAILQITDKGLNWLKDKPEATSWDRKHEEW